jgi:hypothetical protein
LRALSNSAARIARPKKMIAQPGPGAGSAMIPKITTASPITPTTIRNVRSRIGLRATVERHPW